MEKEAAIRFFRQTLEALLITGDEKHCAFCAWRKEGGYGYSSGGNKPATAGGVIEAALRVMELDPEAWRKELGYGMQILASEKSHRSLSMIFMDKVREFCCISMDDMIQAAERLLRE